jgi:hypothetical protein
VAGPEEEDEFSAEFFRVYEKLAAWLTEKWRPERACPYCGSMEWGVDATPMAVDTWHGGRVRFYAVTCRNCTQTCSSTPRKLERCRRRQMMMTRGRFHEHTTAPLSELPDAGAPGRTAYPQVAGNGLG